MIGHEAAHGENSRHQRCAAGIGDELLRHQKPRIDTHNLPDGSAAPFSVRLNQKMRRHQYDRRGIIIRRPSRANRRNNKHPAKGKSQQRHDRLNMVMVTAACQPGALIAIADNHLPHRAGGSAKPRINRIAISILTVVANSDPRPPVNSSAP